MHTICKLSLFKTHPAAEVHRKALAERAPSLMPVAAITGESQYLAAARRFRGMLLADEIDLRQPERSLVVINRMKKMKKQDGIDGGLLCFEGKAYRLRGEGGDQDTAIGLYEQAVADPVTPAEAWRSLGLSYRRDGRHGEASEMCATYLSKKPEASDADLIRSYLSTLS